MATSSPPTVTSSTPAPRFRITLTIRAQPSSISPAAPTTGSISSAASPTPSRTPRTTPLILTAARFNVDDILTRNFLRDFQDAVQQRVDQLVEEEHLGVSIDQCQVQCIPPRQLKDIFAQVTTARQNYDKLINDAAIQDEPDSWNEASAQATSITNAAESARIRFADGRGIDMLPRRSPNCCPDTKADPRLFRPGWNWPRPWHADFDERAGQDVFARSCRWQTG